MKLSEITNCPCTLAEGFRTYSPAGLRLMFNRRKVSHILPFNPPEYNEEVAERFRQNVTNISISGAQFKQSLVVDRDTLRLTRPGEPGRFILKPVPFRPPFGKAEELPANEHLTMQIARQVYGIRTAGCALVFFKNGDPAYLTRRFDYAADGSKIAQEDLASVIGASSGKDGSRFRNSGSYEDVANAMKRHVAAYSVEIEKFFGIIVCNYLFSNGDAHLKNFSLQQSASGDYVLSPSYDLINTAIHIPTDTFFGLEEGLFSDDFETDSFQSLGYYAYDDFFAFGLRIGMMESRIRYLLDNFRTLNPQTLTLIKHSFLSEPIKELYTSHYRQRLAMLNNSFSRK